VTNRTLSSGFGGGETVPDCAASAFTRELIDEVRRDGFRPRAWRRLISRSWARSLDDIRESPSRARSFWSWAAAVAATGFGVVLLARLFHTPELAISAMVLWLPWYACSVIFVLTHLGMADDGRGSAHNSLRTPNGLSFLRLALAPLVLVPFLGLPVHPVSGPAFALFLAGMSVSDILDGWIARRRGICTRLGRMLDSLADLAFITFLAVGLYLAGAIPASLLWLLIVRYPLMLIGVLILYFARGPVPLNPTAIGKVTTFATSILLLVITFKLLLTSDMRSTLWIDWAVSCIHFLVAANVIYLIYRGVVMIDFRRLSGSRS
jgi:cardiolipin synthase